MAVQSGTVAEEEEHQGIEEDSIDVVLEVLNLPSELIVTLSRPLDLTWKRNTSSLALLGMSQPFSMDNAQIN